MQPLNLGCNLQSGKRVLMFVPLAKHPGSLHGSTTILSRLLSHETKTPLLSISTPTPTPARTFVSLSSKLPPVELFFPKEPEYVSQLMVRRLLPGQAECSLSALAATKAAASTPQEALLTNPTKGASSRMVLPAWTLLSAAREAKPSDAAHQQSLQPRLSAGCKAWGGKQLLFFLNSLSHSVMNLRGKNSLAPTEWVARSRS